MRARRRVILMATSGSITATLLLSPETVCDVGHAALARKRRNPETVAASPELDE